MIQNRNQSATEWKGEPGLPSHEDEVHIANQDKIWDYYQTETADDFEGSRARLSFLAHQFSPGQRVLNVGVGGGLFEEVGEARGLEVHALDPSARTIERLRERLGLGERAVVGYSQAMPFPDRYFDGVVFSEVLEHLSDEILSQTLAETRRVLAPGRVIIGTVPARENLKENLVVCPDCGKLFHRWGHLQSFTLDRMRSLLEPHFSVLDLEERPFVTWSTLNWKGKIGVGLKVLLWRLGVHGRAESLYFRAQVAR